MYVQFLIRKSRKRKNIHLQNDWSQVLIPGTANFNQIFQNPPTIYVPTFRVGSSKDNQLVLLTLQSGAFKPQEKERLQRAPAKLQWIETIQKSRQIYGIPVWLKYFKNITPSS